MCFILCLSVGRYNFDNLVCMICDVFLIFFHCCSYLNHFWPAFLWQRYPYMLMSGISCQWESDLDYFFILYKIYTVIFCLINQVPFSGVVPKGLGIQIFPIVVSKFPKSNIFSQNENNLHNKIRLQFFLSALTDPRILSLTLKIKQKKVALAPFCFNQKLLCHSDLKVLVNWLY